MTQDSDTTVHAQHAYLWGNRLVHAALSMLPAAALAGADPSGATWQPWTDQLVYAVLAGLVWGGTKLAAAEEEHGRVMEALTAYMAARPIKVGPQHTHLQALTLPPPCCFTITPEALLLLKTCKATARAMDLGTNCLLHPGFARSQEAVCMDQEGESAIAQYVS